MNQIKNVRNGYIDVIKFCFAVIITEFHLGTGFFPGGRIAVEGFFLISGYLMMKNIKRNKFPDDPLGISTVRFIGNKFKGLFPYLFSAVMLAFTIDNIIYKRNVIQALKRLPLLVFDIVPLREAGFQGDYIVGISWYLSAMFLSLAVLYPLCKKFGSNFVLTVCPVACVMIYGTLSHYYGHLAIATNWLEISLISSGLLRGFAACAAGCVLYEICEVLLKRKTNLKGKILFTILEVIGSIYLYYNMKNNPLSKFEFIMLFVVFAILVIGIGELSFSSVIFRGRWTKFFGVASTLLVLSHYRLNVLFKHFCGPEYIHTSKLYLYLVSLFIACAAVWCCSLLITAVMSKISKIKIWQE